MEPPGHGGSAGGGWLGHSPCSCLPCGPGALRVGTQGHCKEQVNRFLPEGQSHTLVCSLACSLAACALGQMNTRLRLLCVRPGIQGTAGADLLSSSPPPFQLLLGPGLCPGQVTGGGGSSIHSKPCLGVALSGGGPVPHVSWGEEQRPSSPSRLGRYVWARWDGWGLWLSWDRKVPGVQFQQLS